MDGVWGPIAFLLFLVGMLGFFVFMYALGRRERRSDGRKQVSKEGVYLGGWLASSGSDSGSSDCGGGGDGGGGDGGGGDCGGGW